LMTTKLEDAEKLLQGKKFNIGLPVYIPQNDDWLLTIALKLDKGLKQTTTYILLILQ